MSSALFGSVCPRVGLSSRQAPFSSSRTPAVVHLRLGGWGRVGPCLRPSGCSQRSVPSLVSSGDQSRRDSVARADLLVPFRVHLSAYAQLGRAPLPAPTCDQSYVSVRTHRSLSASVSTKTPLAFDGQLRQLYDHGPVGPSSACPRPSGCLLAREACINGELLRLARARGAGACIPTRDVVRDDGASSLSARPLAGACEPKSTRPDGRVHRPTGVTLTTCTPQGVHPQPFSRAPTPASPTTRPKRARASTAAFPSTRPTGARAFPLTSPCGRATRAPTSHPAAGYRHELSPATLRGRRGASSSPCAPNGVRTHREWRVLPACPRAVRVPRRGARERGRTQRCAAHRRTEIACVAFRATRSNPDTR